MGRSRKRARYENEINEDEDALGEGSGVLEHIDDAGTISYEEVRVPLPIAPQPSPQPRRHKHGNATVDATTQESSSFVTGGQINDSGHYDNDNLGDEMGNVSGRKKGESDHIQDFSDKFYVLLDGLQAREAIPVGTTCYRCTQGTVAIWRCRDCTSSKVICRGCMRDAHLETPLHRIERWTGQFFEAAEMWQVGRSVVVPHHNRSMPCATLSFQLQYLQSVQVIKDRAEQENLRQPEFLGNSPTSSVPSQMPVDITKISADGEDIDDSMSDTESSEEDGSEERLPDDPEPAQDWEDVLERARVFPTPEVWPDKPKILPNIARGVHSKENNALNDVAGTHYPPGDLPTEPVPRADAMKNPFVRVIHTNGVHYISLVYCGCQGKDCELQDLLYSRLLPTTFGKYTTLFTTEVLDDYRLSNLECKTSAYQYYQKLCRKTAPTAPSRVPNKYQELRRLSREWRWLKQLKWAGYGNTRADIAHPRAGELTLFCPACPQPGVNLPNNWKDDQERNPNLYVRSFVADGNFKADHVRQRSSARDIWLSEGGGMMPVREEYMKYLAQAQNISTKAECRNLFRVIQLASLGSKACDRTGLVAIACARHGCYCPNSLVDLLFGEQQKNVDFGWLKAMRTTNIEGIRRVLLIYDIVCQYYVHMHDRIGPLLPPGMVIDRAIGMFHVHGHQESCFYRYAPSFIPGAANVAGEILEHLWSGLNQISPSTRTMTLAARADTLNDHTADSNFKKTIGMPFALARSYKKAQYNHTRATEYYANLASTITSSTKVMWDAAIEYAEMTRLDNPAAMDIYKANPPSQGETSGETTAYEDLPPDDFPISRWFNVAIRIEEMQCEVFDAIRSLRQHGPMGDDNHIDNLRQQLVAQLAILETIEKEIGVIKAPLVEIEDGPDAVAFNVDLSEDGDGIPDGSSDPVIGADATVETESQVHGIGGNAYGHAEHIQPENRIIGFPSNVDPTQPKDLHSRSMAQFRDVEVQFRCNQASTLLGKIREHIAERSLQFSDVQRNAPTKGIKTRSRAAIMKIKGRITLYAKMYTRTRDRIVRLTSNPAILAKFARLVPSDLVSSTALLYPNEPGSKSVTLSWIWRLNSTQPEDSPEALEEFRRVHYLRARAMKQRWHEELLLVGREMTWSAQYYLHQANLWRERAQHPADNAMAGATAYALRKEAMWKGIYLAAQELYREINSNYLSL